MKLSDTQLVVLGAACQRDDRRVLPLPPRLKGGAAQKVVQGLLTKGLVAEIPAELGDNDWRVDADEHRLTLVVTDAAFAALGIDEAGGGDEPADTGATSPDVGQEAEAAAVDAGTEEEAPVAATEPKTRKTRANSKQAQLIAMLERPEGATITEITEAFGWQSHTARGAIAGALKKKLGLEVTSDKEDGRGRVYRIGSEG